MRVIVTFKGDERDPVAIDNVTHVKVEAGALYIFKGDYRRIVYATGTWFSYEMVNM